MGYKLESLNINKKVPNQKTKKIKIEARNKDKKVQEGQ